MSAFEQLDSLIREQKNQIHALNETLKEVDIATGGSEVGETIEPGTQYVVSGVTYTTGIGAEIFNNYEDASTDLRNKAAGKYTHVEGSSNGAYSDYSHAEGNGNTVTGIGGHAEGQGTLVSGNNGHAEGFNSVSDGSNAHAEGSSYAHGLSAHSEGFSNRDVSTPANTTGALGDYSHAEGYNCKAVGNYSHTEGYRNTAVGAYSHTEGNNNTAQGEYSHAEGNGNNIAAVAYGAHVEGQGNTVTAINAHAEGYGCYANGNASHCEGYDNHANGIRSHCEGYNSEANGDASHAEGTHCTANAQNAHAGGNYSTASATNTFAHGGNCAASAVQSTAFGNYSTASGPNSFAIGSNTEASNYNSLAAGDHTLSSGTDATSMGAYTIAAGRAQLVIGECNVADASTVTMTDASSNTYSLTKYPLIIGNGNQNFGTPIRSDAFKVDCEGKIYVGDNDGVDVSGLNVTSSDNKKVLTASYQNGVGTYSWQDAPESGVCVVHTYTDTSLPAKVVLDNNNEYRYLSLTNANSLTISIETIDTTKSFYSTIVLHNVTSTNSLSTFVTVSGDSVISNIVFLNENNVDLSTADTAELLFFTNGMSNTVMCIAYAYGTSTP